MAGRGNRSQGTLSAHIYLTSGKKGLNAKAILNENSKERIADCVKIINKLQSSFDDEKDIIDKIVAATANMAWTKGFSGIKDI
jgi:hypothetical protein